MLKSCMDESTLKFSESKLDELTRALFESADVDNSGTISFEELQAELDKHPGVIENLTIRYTNLVPCEAVRMYKKQLMGVSIITPKPSMLCGTGPNPNPVLYANLWSSSIAI